MKNSSQHKNGMLLQPENVRPTYRFHLFFDSPAVGIQFVCGINPLFFTPTFLIPSLTKRNCLCSILEKILNIIQCSKRSDRL